jgi:CRISPR-associated protein Csx14
MLRNKAQQELMLATLGTEPQVITLTLDKLLTAGHAVSETILVYTEHPAIKDNIQILEKEFRQVYSGVTLRLAPVTNSKGYVKDFLSEEDLCGLLRTLYIETRRARQAKYRVHMCISGGRKVMAVIAMSVAQLLFGPADQVWYLITEGWQPGNERRLHATESDKILLLPVPILRWNEADTLLRTVTELNDPQEVLVWYKRLTNKAEEKRKDEFIRHWLTPAEREVTHLACLGFDNAAIAAKLAKQEQTVANQLRGVYEKLREWLAFPDYTVDRSVLISRFAPYFSLIESEVKW